MSDKYRIYENVCKDGISYGKYEAKYDGELVWHPIIWMEDGVINYNVGTIYDIPKTAEPTLESIDRILDELQMTPRKVIKKFMMKHSNQ